MKLIPELHTRALLLANDYRRCESALLDILEQIESNKIFLQMGYASLFAYATEALKLSEFTAYSMIQIMRKSKQVPELKAAVADGTLSLSKAHRIVSVLEPKNKDEWIEKAKTLPRIELERAIAKVAPEQLRRESLHAVNDKITRMALNLESTVVDQLRRAQILLVTKFKRNVALDEVIGHLAADYLHRNDPLKKAEKYHARQESHPNGSKMISSKQQGGRAGADLRLEKEAAAPIKEESIQASETRAPRITKSYFVPGHKTTRAIPSSIRLQVEWRDQNRCQFQSADGKICASRIGLQIHHDKPWAIGGDHSLDNLITLCGPHHHWHHSEKSTGAPSLIGGLLGLNTRYAGPLTL